MDETKYTHTATSNTTSSTCKSTAHVVLISKIPEIKISNVQLSGIVCILLSAEGSLKNKSCHDANFVITGGTAGCYDNLQCHQWWQSWHHEDSWFSVIMFQMETPIINSPGTPSDTVTSDKFITWVNVMAADDLGRWTHQAIFDQGPRCY